MDIDLKDLTVDVLDIETGGLDYNRDSIYQVGIVRLYIYNGSVEKVFNCTCREYDKRKPRRDDWIFMNSDLKYEDVVKAPPLSDFKNELQNIFSNNIMTAFKSDFDFGFLKLRGYKFPHVTFDPMIFLTPILKLRPKKKGTKYKFPSVQEAWYIMYPENIRYEPHLAVDDAEMEAKIYYACVTRYGAKI